MTEAAAIHAGLLVVAGEGSGDEMAAPVVRRLKTRAWGIGGAHLEAAGVELVGDVRRLSAMGLGTLVPRVSSIAAATSRLVRRAGARRPRAALLVGFSELNAHLGAWLRRRGVPVVWYAPPQVWAWRRRRAPRLAHSADRLALILPFEQPLWQSAGAKATYVGHPAVERHPPTSKLPKPCAERRVAVFPGSRDHEVRRHLLPMLEAARRLEHRKQVGLAPSLSSSTERWATALCERRGATVLRRPAAEVLQGCSAAVAASGTVTLDCALAGVPPVIAYRTDSLTWAAASRLVRVEYVGLPNLVLGRRAFPELLQHAVTAEALAGALSGVLVQRRELLRSCSEVRKRLSARDTLAPSSKVAALIAPWLDGS